jgi:hypothetical protein
LLELARPLGERRAVQLTLTCHPATPTADPGFKLWATVDHVASFGAVATINIWFGIGAPAGRFVMPPAPPEPGRRDGLWKSTCFEAFLRASGEAAYREWNFAPSGDWAAYDFAAYREGMREADIGAPPYLRREDNLTWWTLGATITADAATRWDLGLSAVLEEAGGCKSYWALAHAAGPPDFHHPDCFTAKLA